VGGPGDNSNTGAAWVYTLSGVWTQQGKLAANDAVGSAAQGWSVALDGNSYAIVGGPGDNSNTGAAWVYTLSGGFWTQQGSKLVANDAVGQARQGWSVVVRSNTPKAIVGGPGDNSNAGAAWVYHNYQNAGVWTQLGSKLVGTGAVGEAQQGSSVQLSNDEDTALVGGSADNSGAGAIWLYQCAAPPNCGGLLTQQGSKLVGTGAVGKAQQGSSIAWSADANIAINRAERGLIDADLGHGLIKQWPAQVRAAAAGSAPLLPIGSASGPCSCSALRKVIKRT
jgi:hypothetical protein